MLGEVGPIHAAYGLPQAAPSQSGAVRRREIKVGGKRVKTVDAHCHVFVPEVADLLKGTPLEKAGGTSQAVLR